MVGATLPCLSARMWTLSLDPILLRQGPLDLPQGSIKIFKSFFHFLGHLLGEGTRTYRSLHDDLPTFLRGCAADHGRPVQRNGRRPMGIATVTTDPQASLI